MKRVTAFRLREEKRVKLGGQLQRKEDDIKASRIVGRELFLKLVGSVSPGVFRDLLQPLEFSGLSSQANEDPSIKEWFIRYFVLHTKYREMFMDDVSILGCSSTVRDTPVLAYFEYVQSQLFTPREIAADQTEIVESHTVPAGMDELTDWRANKSLITGWQALKTTQGSERLTFALTKWAAKWNLEEEWCFDFALECLGRLKVDFVDKFHPDSGYLQNTDPIGLMEYKMFWMHGRPWHDVLFVRRLARIHENDLKERGITAEIEHRLTFDYRWPFSLCVNGKGAFTIRSFYNPMNYTFTEFTVPIEREFWLKFFDYYKIHSTALVGRFDEVVDGLKDFHKKLKEFGETSEELEKGFTEKAVTLKDTTHFRWLVNYQVNKWSLADIARDAGVTPQAVKRGTAGVAEIIGLKMRQPSRGGRPKGSRTNNRGAGRVTKVPKPPT